LVFGFHIIVWVVDLQRPAFRKLVHIAVDFAHHLNVFSA
jgi:hypothetical protein